MNQWVFSLPQSSAVHIPLWTAADEQILADPYSRPQDLAYFYYSIWNLDDWGAIKQTNGIILQLSVFNAVKIKMLSIF